ncbi:helix-turn-helix domain-containing protein [Parafilimonas sp.]|uniref:helix-turn-helix domain-containing protein n=1 Tax=Parafilimonas sp. TaxID=1969739 RepID=UPI0039E28D3F
MSTTTITKNNRAADVTVTDLNGNKHTTSLFNVYRREDYLCRSHSAYSRRDYYKISLIIGTGILYYAEKGIEINKPALLFSNPNVPYAWEASSEEQSGYFCLFKEDFIRHEELAHIPMFKIGGEPLFFISETQQKFISSLFEKMLDEIETDYTFKHDLLRNYVYLIIHEAMKMHPADAYFRPSNASARIASLFMELLERQFPIDSPAHNFKFKTANDYALHLSVHVNHLNRAVKEVTGKTTTTHISERIITEAKALLRHTDWNISEIAYSLGFDYPAYFNNFFKKQTNTNPKAYRQSLVD